MAKFGKKYQDAAKLVEAGKAYDLAEAIEVVKKTATAKFDESVDVAVRLGVNPKYADQQVRGAVVLPHGTGKSKRVLVFAKGDKVAEAEAEFLSIQFLLDILYPFLLKTTITAAFFIFPGKYHTLCLQLQPIV